jgi:hypothetical protein
VGLTVEQAKRALGRAGGVIRWTEHDAGGFDLYVQAGTVTSHVRVANTSPATIDAHLVELVEDLLARLPKETRA